MLRWNARTGGRRRGEGRMIDNRVRTPFIILPDDLLHTFTAVSLLC